MRKLTILLKRTMIVLCLLFCTEMIAFGSLISGSQEAHIVGNVPALPVTDATYMQPIEPPEEVEAEAVIASEEVVEVEEVAVVTDEPYQEEVYEESATPSYDGGGYVDANVDGAWISGSDFMSRGVYYDNGSEFSYTWYSENVLPGGGLSIPGRHVGDEGYVMDGDGNLCVASDDLPYGTVVNVPFGSGTAVVYDCGGGHGNLDVYVSW